MRFHISAATDPKVDLFLENQGFVIQSPSAVYQAVCNNILKNHIFINTSLELKIEESLEDEWLEDFLRLEQHPGERKPTYAQIFSGISLRICYMRLYEDDELVGLGTAVLDGAWAGFGNIITSQTHRNRGIGTRIVHELASGVNQMARNDFSFRLCETLGLHLIYTASWASLQFMITIIALGYSNSLNTVCLIESHKHENNFLHSYKLKTAQLSDGFYLLSLIAQQFERNQSLLFQLVMIFPHLDPLLLE